MSNLRVLVMSFGLFLALGITNGAATASAQSNPRFIPFGGGANGALYVPNSVTPKCILRMGRWLIRSSS